MIIEKKFFGKGMDGDMNHRMLPDGAMLNAMNCRMAVTMFGRDGRLENVPGTQLITQSVFPPYGTSQTIGGCVDEVRNNILWFNYNSAGDHGIYCFERSSGIVYAVLYDSQIMGGLNFDKNYRIDRNVKVIGDLLIWTDNNNEPKCINYIAGIKTNSASYVSDVLPYSWPIKYETTTLIKRPPIYRLQPTKVTDSSFDNNLIKNRAYQFTYRYHYRDRQISVLSVYSQLMPFNAKEDGSNAIDIELSSAEYIDDDVQQVDICVRYGNTGKTLVVKRYNKDNEADRNAILAHNSGAAQLGFRFYDDIVGEPLSELDANLPFDSVPIRAKTTEYARSRVHLANYISGYDTPTESSLAVTLDDIDTGASGSFAGTWGFVTLNANYTDVGIQDDFMFPFVRRTSDSSLYYFPSVRNSGGGIWNGGTGPVPSSINLSQATLQAANEATLIAYLKETNYPPTPGLGGIGTPPWDVAYSISFGSLGSVSVVDFEPISVNQFFKTNSTYLVSIAFYDRFRRKCGVLRNPVQVSIPIRTWSQTQFTTILQWTLSNTNASDEIPDWAYYYQIHITKNQTTRFFTEARTYNATYVTKNQDGTFTYGNPNFTDQTYAVGFDITTLNNYGLGYTYTEGDLANIFFVSGDPWTLPVLGTDGTWVHLQPVDFGFGLNFDTNLLLELFTPYKSLGDKEPYFEVGDMIPVSNPGTAQRAYSLLVGQINGDTYALERQDKNGGIFPNQLYIVEAMSPNDNVWQIWETDTGWPTFFDDIGQVTITDKGRYSDTFIKGSKVNGINKFLPLNEYDCDGAVQKLQLANKIADEGTVMLAICVDFTVSLYLGETQLVASAQNAFVAQSPGVVGSKNVLKPHLGTQHPETILEYRGLVFGYDVSKGCVWQYSVNGQDIVSRFGQTRFFQRYAIGIAAASPGNLDNINGFHHMPFGIDPFHKELICTLPAFTYPNYASTLPSYSSVPSYASSIINRFDIFDSLGKTMCYSYEKNNWGSNFEFMGEFYETLNNELYGFKDGRLYRFYVTANWNTFFGVQYPVRICVTANMNPSALKDLMNIGIESSVAPDFTVAMTAVPDQQITDLAADDYDDNQGFFYATFFKDRLSPNTSGTVDEKLYTGDVLTDIAPMVMCEFQQYSALMWVEFINLGYEISKGQKQIANPSNG